ncbi:MAG: class I SAM-dependent methyltransferase [Chloroflexota bacterium]|nr:class I SAM-dependent methyltransferase [Chloroflexota bacterium]
MPLWYRLVTFGFRLLYHEMAWTYDVVSRMVSFGQWRCWTQQVLAHLNVMPGALVLELAHGTGNVQLDLHQAGYRVLGLDFSPQMGGIAQHKLRRAGLAARLVRGRAQELPFADASVEAIACTFPTPFILEESTLREASRVLRPGARLVIVPNAVLTGADVGTAALEWLYRVTGQRGGGGLDITGYFAQYGFDAQVVTSDCQQSRVTVIIAVKRG